MSNQYGNFFGTLNSSSNSNPKFEIKKSSNNQFYFVLKAPNGQVLVTSETYTTKQSCKNGINSVIQNASIAHVVDNT